MLAALIKKELLALMRDMHGMAALFVLPVVFIVVMSLALKDVYSPPQRTMQYAVDVRDTGELAQTLLKRWQDSHGKPQPLPADWQTALRTGKLNYVVVLKAGLSNELAVPTLPTQASIHLLTEPGMDNNLFNSLHTELGGMAGEVKARHALSRINALASEQPTTMLHVVQAERFAGQAARPSAVQQNVPAWLVFGMFFVVASLSNLLVQERSSGALARLESLGVPRWLLLASKALPYLAVNAVQAALMLCVGVWLMPHIGGDALSLQGIHWPALLVAVGAISLAAVGTALVLACAVRTHAQAAAVGPTVNILMAALGGIMVPTFVMPSFMQEIAAFSPMGWGLEALLVVMLRAGDVTELMPSTLRLLAYAALMFSLALLIFHRRTP
jgi:ABC-2 type transport system permease protein